MGCRCSDIAELQADIDTLKDIYTMADELSSYDDTIQDNLKDIAEVINDTVIVKSENIHIKFKQLNNQSRSAIDGMYTKINGLIGELTQKLNDAKREDALWQH